ncbi:MAG: GTP-binding protein [Promethearchaeota archaeon]|nr:MAG: GTP-binding protein [Candidatus Lokiarchaeota archaeon]
MNKYIHFTLEVGIISDKNDLFKFKIPLFGTSNVGKTSLILRFVNESFVNDIKKTIGTNFLVKDFEMDRKNIRLLIWDIGGQAQFSNMRTVYFKGSNAAIGVFDITSSDSILKIPKWIATIEKLGLKIPMLLLGNKYDLAPNMQIVKEKEIKELISQVSKQMGVPVEFMYTSALNGLNVEEAFSIIAKMCIENSPK